MRLILMVGLALAVGSAGCKDDEEPPDLPCATAAEIDGLRLNYRVKLPGGGPARTNPINGGAKALRICDEAE
jgi:hypothetical protein